MSYVKKTDLVSKGFRCFAGPFGPEEEAMIPGYVNDAVNCNKEVRRSVEAPGVYLWQRSKFGR